MEDTITTLKEWGVVDVAWNIVGAVLIFFVGKWVAGLLRKVIEKVMAKSKQEQTLISFVGNLTYVVTLVFVIIAALGKLGVQTAQFVAIIGAAGLAVGLALQGSLANFAAGLLLVIFRPFKVGDFIEASGESGEVTNIEIFTTTLRTVDNKKVIIPNAKASADNIINYTAEEIRRIDLVIGVAYDADHDHTRKVIADVLAANGKVLTDPPAQIAISELADSSVNWVVRPWVKTGDYWDVYFEAHEAIKASLDAAGIGIPFPQRDVHVYKHALDES